MSFQDRDRTLVHKFNDYFVVPRIHCSTFISSFHCFYVGHITQLEIFVLLMPTQISTINRQQVFSFVKDCVFDIAIHQKEEPKREQEGQDEVLHNCNSAMVSQEIISQSEYDEETTKPESNT